MYYVIAVHVLVSLVRWSLGLCQQIPAQLTDVHANASIVFLTVFKVFRRRELLAEDDATRIAPN